MTKFTKIFLAINTFLHLPVAMKQSKPAKPLLHIQLPSSSQTPLPRHVDASSQYATRSIRTLLKIIKTPHYGLIIQSRYLQLGTFQSFGQL